MKFHEINRPKGAVHKKKRVGRGDGSGLGKTAGRGSNGQKSRSGAKIRAGFEGGQMPLIRRVPKRGFRNIFKVTFSLINVSALNEMFDNDQVVDIQSFIEKGLIKSDKKKIKILGKGELEKKLVVKAHAFSNSAKEKIEKAGGTVEII